MQNDNYLSLVNFKENFIVRDFFEMNTMLEVQIQKKFWTSNIMFIY